MKTNCRTWKYSSTIYWISLEIQSLEHRTIILLYWAQTHLSGSFWSVCCKSRMFGRSVQVFWVSVQPSKGCRSFGFWLRWVNKTKCCTVQPFLVAYQPKYIEPIIIENKSFSMKALFVLKKYKLIIIYSTYNTTNNRKWKTLSFHLTILIHVLL